MMITEKQKQLIFDINCYYQLECQKEKFNAGQPIEFFPELNFLALDAMQGRQIINWKVKYWELYFKLKQYGLSDSWLFTLKTSLNNHLNSGGSPISFRHLFMTLIDQITTSVTSIVSQSDPSIPKKYIAEDVINNIFLGDYWTGAVLQQIIILKEISINLGLDKNFLIEFGKILVKI